MARPWRRSPLRLAATTVVAAAVAACLDPPCRVAGALPPARPPGAVDATPRPGWVLPPLLGSAPDATYGTPVRRVVTSSVNFPFASILRAGLQVEDPGGGYVMFYEADRDQSFHFKNMSVYERRSGLPWARPANTIDRWHAPLAPRRGPAGAGLLPWHIPQLNVVGAPHR